MPWSCAVPHCTGNKYKWTDNLSTFKVPSDPELRRKWVSAMPGVDHLRSHQRICEKHFIESAIIKEYIKYDKDGKINGKIIAQVKSESAFYLL